MDTLPQHDRTPHAAPRPADPAGLHRRVTAISLAGSAALVALGGAIAPENSGEPDELYRMAIEDSGRLTAEAVLMVVSSVLLVFGVIGTARLVRGRGRHLARAAAVLGVMGALGHAAYATFTLLLPPIVTSASGREAAIATLEEINSSGGGAVVVPLILAYALSVLLLPIALYRGGLAPLWVVGLAAAAVAIEAFPSGAVDLSLVKYTLALAAMAAIAARILRLSDAEWRDPSTIGTASR